MRGRAFIRITCALFCALAVHAALVTGAVRYGWFSSDDTTLPELDLTSVDLSFSETPEETAPPAAQPPPSPAEPQPPTPPPPALDPTPPPPAVDLPPSSAIEPPPPPTIELPHLPETDPLLALESDLNSKAQESESESQTGHDTLKNEQESSQPDSQKKQTHMQPVPTTEPTPAPPQPRVKVDNPPKPNRPITVPQYPEGARNRKESGDVKLEFEVLANGTVGNVWIVKSCGYKELEQAAIKDIRQVRFNPARSHGTNVTAVSSFTYEFRIKEESNLWKSLYLPFAR